MNYSKRIIYRLQADYAMEHLAELGFDPQEGARPLKRIIQKYILNELSKYILSGQITSDQKIVLDMFDNKFVFRNIENYKKHIKRCGAVYKKIRIIY